MKRETYEHIVELLRMYTDGSEFENHVYAVGGCVRDSLLGDEIKDIDLVVDLPNGGIRLAEYLQSYGYVKGSLVTYENYGTVMFRLKLYPNIELEAVQTRREDYHDAKTRNPVTSFGSIEDDCRRRDFTINALYRNVTTGEVIDFNGMGLRDLEAGIIDTCGDPDIIFNEDPLRILRAVRFAARLEYKLSDRAKEGIVRNKGRLEIITQERITDEFNKILSGPRPEIGVEMMHLMDLFPYVLPEIRDHVAFNLYSVAKDVRNIRMSCFNNGKEPLLLMLAYFSTIIGPDIFKVVMRRMKYSNEETDKVFLYATAFRKAEFVNMTKSTVHLRELEYSVKTKEDYSMVMTLFSAGRDEPYIWERMRTDNEHPMLGYRLPVDGFDVMETLNISPGSTVKEVLDDLMNDAYVNPAITRDECLELIRLRFAKNK